MNAIVEFVQRLSPCRPRPITPPPIANALACPPLIAEFAAIVEVHERHVRSTRPGSHSDEIAPPPALQEDELLLQSAMLFENVEYSLTIESKALTPPPLMKQVSQSESALLSLIVLPTTVTVEGVGIIGSVIDATAIGPGHVRDRRVPRRERQPACTRSALLPSIVKRIEARANEREIRNGADQRAALQRDQRASEPTHVDRVAVARAFDRLAQRAVAAVIGAARHCDDIAGCLVRRRGGAKAGKRIEECGRWTEPPCECFGVWRAGNRVGLHGAERARAAARERVKVARFAAARRVWVIAMGAPGSATSTATKRPCARRRPGPCDTAKQQQTGHATGDRHARFVGRRVAPSGNAFANQPARLRRRCVYRSRRAGESSPRPAGDRTRDAKAPSVARL